MQVAKFDDLKALSQDPGSSVGRGRKRSHFGDDIPSLVIVSGS